MLNQIHKSISIIKKSINFFGSKNIAVSFNGGNDNTVVFSLIYYYIKKNVIRDMPIFVYFKTKYHFHQIEEYMNFIVSTYNLNFMCYECDNLKDGLIQFKKDYPHINCIFMGNRRTDPYSNKLNHFSSTTNEWPYYVRVNPILNWSYKQVWNYIFIHDIKVCVLYKLGYTSLGSIKDTSRNPYLSYQNKYGMTIYKPAWYLKNEENERAGRKEIIIRINRKKYDKK